jgi:hypothetical protein
MFISQLIHKLNEYDPYRIHFWNGIRAIIALLSLFCIRFIYGIENPYFYFFYIPITCLSLELLGETIYEKTKIYLQAIFWSSLGVVLFNLSANHPILELIITFSFSMFVYHFFINNYPYPLISSATILSLAAYSLNYENLDFYNLLHNFSITLFAGIIIAFILNIFPKNIYLKIWYRIFLHSIQLTIELLETPSSSEKKIYLLSLFPLQLRYARMYKKKHITLLKTSALLQALINNLIAISTYPELFLENKENLKKNIIILFKNINQYTACTFDVSKKSNTSLILLHKIIKQWNQICKENL